MNQGLSSRILFLSAIVALSIFGFNETATATSDTPVDTQEIESGGVVSVDADADASPAEQATNTERPASPDGYLNSCESDAKIAKNACLMPGTSGMDAGQAMMYTAAINQLIMMAPRIASVGKNMAKQCELQADISKIMTAVNGVKGGTCATYISKCNTSCDKEAEENTNAANSLESNPATQAAAAQYQKAARRNKVQAKTCTAYSTQVTTMMMTTMQSMGNFAANKQCASDAAAFNAAAASFKPIEMPKMGDCSDPNNQSLTCYCQKEANAKSVMCAGFTNGGSLAGTTTAVPNGTGSAAAAPKGSSLSSDSEGGVDDSIAAGSKQKGAGGGPNGQGDGGSGAPGGGGLAALGSDGGGSQGGGDSKSAITGTSGGTANGLGGSGGGGGGLARNNGGGGGGGFLDKFNLKQFLPGTKYKTRGIAGMSVKSVDGITGPTGPSIWEKATRQYQEQIQKQNVLLEK